MTLRRGVELVDAVMKHRRDAGESFEGLPADELKNTKLGTQPLSPALERWLAADAEYFSLSEPMTLRELLVQEFGEDWAEAFEPLPSELKAPVVLLEGWGSDSRRFIYLGPRDSMGEPCVMTVDMDDMPFFCINGPLDVWLAQQAGLLEDEQVYGHVPVEYEPARHEHARLHFDGYICWGDGMRSRTLDLEEGDLEGDDEA